MSEALSYTIEKPEGGWRAVSSFTVAERKRLWPIAETLAMLDGNAFFIWEGRYLWNHIEQYLPEASALYEANGGDRGWAGEALLGKDPSTLLRKPPSQVSDQ